MDDNNNNNNYSRETEQVESAVDTLSVLSSGKNPSSPDFGMDSSKLKDEALILLILATPPREKEGYGNHSKDLTIDIDTVPTDISSLSLDRYSVTSLLSEDTAQNLDLDNVDHEAKDGVRDVQQATVEDKVGTKSTPDLDSVEIELKVGINNNTEQNVSSAGGSPALMTTKSDTSSLFVSLFPIHFITLAITLALIIMLLIILNVQEHKNAMKFENLQRDYMNLYRIHSETLQNYLDERKYADETTARAIFRAVALQVMTTAGKKILENLFTYYLEMK